MMRRTTVVGHCMAKDFLICIHVSFLALVRFPHADSVYVLVDIEAEVRYAVKHEYAVKATDVLARRTRLTFLNAQVSLISPTCLLSIHSYFIGRTRCIASRRRHHGIPSWLGPLTQKARDSKHCQISGKHGLETRSRGGTIQGSRRAARAYPSRMA